MDKNLCAICGAEVKHPMLPLCLECSPYYYKKQGSPHQKLRRRKAWKEKREEFLNQTNLRCKHCEKEDTKYHIHHEKNGITSRTYERIWIDLFNNKFGAIVEESKERMKEFENFCRKDVLKSLNSSINHFTQKIKCNLSNCCPKCNSTRYNERKKLKPKYRCSSCGNEFENTIQKARDNSKYEKKIQALKFVIENYEEIVEGDKKIRIEIAKELNYAENVALNNYFKKILPDFYSELKIQYEQEVEKILELYLSMEGSIVLCNRCHIAREKGLVLCKFCENYYHNPRYEMCIHCNNNSSKFCPGCHHFYSSLNHKKCPKCNIIYFKNGSYLEDLFKISKGQYYVRLNEAECIRCGKDTFDTTNQNIVSIKDIEKDEDYHFGHLCEECHKQFLKSYKEEDSILIKITINEDIF